MATHVYANNNEIASKAADGKSIAAFPDVCFSPPSPPAGPMPLPYPNTGEVKDTDKGTAKVFIKDEMTGMEGDSYLTKSTGDEAATQSQGKGIITSALQGKCYFGVWSMDVKAEGKGVPRHLDMVTHNHASTPTQIGGPHTSKNKTPAKPPETRNWLISCTGEMHRNNFIAGQSVYELVCDQPVTSKKKYADNVTIKENPKCTTVLFNGNSVQKSGNSFKIKPDVNIVLREAKFDAVYDVLCLYTSKNKGIYKSHTLSIDGTNSYIHAFPGDHCEIVLMCPVIYKKEAKKDYSFLKNLKKPSKQGSTTKKSIGKKSNISKPLYDIVQKKKQKLAVVAKTIQNKIGKISIDDTTTQNNYKIQFVRSFPDGKAEYTIDFVELNAIIGSFKKFVKFFDALKNFGYGFFGDINFSALEDFSVHVETGFIELPHNHTVANYRKYSMSGTLLTFDAQLCFGFKCVVSAYAYIKIECILDVNAGWEFPAPAKSAISAGAAFNVTPSIGIAIDAILCELDAGAELPFVFSAELQIYARVPFKFGGVCNGLTLKVTFKTIFTETNKTWATSLLKGRMF